MKKKKNKKPTKCIFTQSCGIFKNDILVSVGGSYKDILNYIKKNAEDWFPKAIKEKKEIIEELLTAKGFAMMDKSFRGAGIIWIKSYKNRWEDIETLLHELHHMVFMVARQKHFEEEMEAQAFLFENLFQQIRRGIVNKLKDKGR